MSRPQAPCRITGCGQKTRSVVGRCEAHRKPIPVSAGSHLVNIGPIAVSRAAAIDLSNRIVDAIEKAERD